MSNAILVNPPTDPYLLRAFEIENVRLGAAVAAMRAVLPSLRFLDADMEGMNTADLSAVINADAPNMVVIHLMYRNLASGIALAQYLHASPRPPLIVAFGHAATISAEDLLSREPSFAAIVRGTPEETLADLARAWMKDEPWYGVSGLVLRSRDGLLVATPLRSALVNIDHLPPPVRDYLPISLARSPIVEVLTSRGCHARCSFCNVPLLSEGYNGYPWRGHSPDRVIDELTELWEHYKVCHVEFVDDNFIGPGDAGRKRAIAIAEGIIGRKLPLTFQIHCRADDIELELFKVLKTAGLKTVHFGIESAIPRLMHRFGKHISHQRIHKALAVLHQLGIGAVPSFIMFEPTITLAELRQNLAFLSKHNLPHLISPTEVIPFRGTLLTKTLAREGLLAPDRFVVPGYIPEVRYLDERVEMLKTWWDRWQASVDEHFRMLLTTLTRSFYAGFEQHTYDDQNQEKINAMFRKLKWYESDLVLGHIDVLTRETVCSELSVEDIIHVAEDKVLHQLFESMSATI